MDFFQTMVGGLITTIIYVMLFAAVYKLFKISSDLSDIKDLLVDLKRSREAEGIINLAMNTQHPPESETQTKVWTPEIVSSGPDARS